MKRCPRCNRTASKFFAPEERDVFSFAALFKSHSKGVPCVSFRTAAGRMESLHIALLTECGCTKTRSYKHVTPPE